MRKRRLPESIFCQHMRLLVRKTWRSSPSTSDERSNALNACMHIIDFHLARVPPRTKNLHIHSQILAARCREERAHDDNVERDHDEPFDPIGFFVCCHVVHEKARA